MLIPGCGNDRYGDYNRLINFHEDVLRDLSTPFQMRSFPDQNQPCDFQYTLPFGSFSLPFKATPVPSMIGLSSAYGLETDEHKIVFLKPKKIKQYSQPEDHPFADIDGNILYKEKVKQDFTFMKRVVQTEPKTKDELNQMSEKEFKFYVATAACKAEWFSDMDKLVICDEQPLPAIISFPNTSPDFAKVTLYIYLKDGYHIVVIIQRKDNKPIEDPAVIYQVYDCFRHTLIINKEKRVIESMNKLNANEV